MKRHVLAVMGLSAFLAAACGDSGGEGGQGGVGGEGASDTSKTSSESSTGSTSSGMSSSSSSASSGSSSSDSSSSSSASSTSSSSSSTSSSSSNSSTSSSSSSSSGSSTSSSSSSATISVTVSSVSGSSSTGMQLCDTGVPDNINSQTCTDCVDCSAQGACNAEANAYINDPFVQDWLDCVNACSSNACFVGCNNAYPSTATVYYAFYDCVVCNDCPNNCDAATNCGALPTDCDDGTFDTIDSPLCGDCIDCTANGSCSSEWDDFFAEPNAQNWIDCVNLCSTQACYDQCFATYPNTTNAYIAALDCSVCVECTNNCDAATNCGP